MATSKNPFFSGRPIADQLKNPKLNPEALKRQNIPRLPHFIELTPAEPEKGGNFLLYAGATTINKDPANPYVEFVVPEANYTWQTHYVAVNFVASSEANHYLVEYSVEVKPKATSPGKIVKYYFVTKGPYLDDEITGGGDYVKGHPVSMEIPALEGQFNLTSSIRLSEIPEDPTTWLFKKVRIFFYNSL